MTEPSHGTPRRGGCPDPEQLALHAEGALGAAEAAWMDEHIAGCAACFEVYAETLRHILESPEQGAKARDVARSALWQRPIFKLAAAVVLAIGLVASLFTSTLSSRRGPSNGTPLALVAPLAKAMGARRFIEPRVTGGFQHARLVVLRSGDAPQGLDAEPPAVLAAVAQIRERAEADTSPETLGAVALTYLVSGDAGAAVKALESATTQAPESAPLWSDLAAAYLVRASRLDEPADIPKALEAAERAIALANPPTEAWFNRALALESLHLDDAARQAWEDYLQRDPSSGWADEARQHLEAHPKVRQSTVEEDSARVRAALDEGPAAVDRLADEAPSLLRNSFDDDLLPAWAEAHLVGHPDEGLHREHARALGDALLRVTGDALYRDTAQALSTPQAPATPAPDATSPDPLRDQAQGFRALKEAKRLYDLEEPSCATFRGALRDLLAGQSPYAAWARQLVATSCLVTPEQPAALNELASLHALAEDRRYIQVLGRARWLQWLLHGSRAELTTALERTRSGLGSFRTTHDVEAEARMLASSAETLHFLGETRPAWRERVRALALLDQVRTPRHRHFLLGEAVLACVDQGLPRAALHFQTAQLVTALAAARPIAIADTLLSRAGIHTGLGARGRAASDLAESRGWIARVSDERRAERLSAEADAVEAHLVVEMSPGEAARLAERSLTHFATAPIRAPALHLVAARAEEAQGRDDAAEAHLLAGIETLEQQRVSLRDAGLQASFFDQALPLFDDMVRLQLTRRRDSERALEFVERGRARQVVDSLLDTAGSRAGTASEAAPLGPAALRAVLPDGLVLVYYVALDDRLLVWTLTREGAHLVERGLPRAALAPLVAAHGTALERRSQMAEVHRTSGRLYDELVRPLSPFLLGKRALVFVPDGILQSLAFASLWDRETGRWLVEDFMVGVTPSATVFVRASAAAADPRRHQGRPAFLVGNPRFDRRVWADLPTLPGAEAEVVELASLYPRARLLTTVAATKEAFLRGVRDSEIVHFAGHATGRPDAPSSLRLLLAPDALTGDDGALLLQEFERIKFPRTRVVVLAACRTASGSVSRLEGALSLARPFLGAGVPNVVASLWDVDDTLSRRFFVIFHRALLAGAEPADAVREAQLALLRDHDASLSHPTSWAAFVSMGGLSPHSLVSKGELS